MKVKDKQPSFSFSADIQGFFVEIHFDFHYSVRKCALRYTGGFAVLSVAKYSIRDGLRRLET